MTGGVVAGRATRDALFLTHHPASALPAVMLASAVLGLLGAAALSRWVARSGPARVVPIALVVNGVIFLGEWVALERSARPAAAALSMHVTALGPLLTSGFWSVVSERFDPHTAKRNVSRVAGAGALAGVFGGVAAERVASMASIHWTLGLLFVLSLGAAVAVRGVGGPPDADHGGKGRDALEGSSMLGFLSRHPLLGPMALLMILGAAVDAFVDFALKAEAAAAWPDTQQLVRFFAGFYVATGLLTFAVQVGAGARVLRTFGLGGAMGVMPAAVIATGGLALLTGRFWSVVLVRGIESVASGGLFRSGFELLYTPVSAAVKRPVKAWIDVSARSAGSMLGAGLVMFLLFVTPDLDTGVIIALAMLASVFLLVGVVRVDRAYVAQLGSSLRSGQISPLELDAEDATTVRTVAHTHMGIDRRTLLAEARAYGESEARKREAETSRETPEVDVAEAPDAAPAEAPVRGTERLHSADPALARAIELGSGDPGRVRSALHASQTASGAEDRRVAAHVIPLLAEPSLARDAEAFLRRVAPRALGQLVDALLDRTEDRGVRLALARIVSGVTERRALEGLWTALEDPDFALRRACAEGAVRLVEHRRELAPRKETVHAQVERELGAAVADTDAIEPPLRVEQIFALLSLLHGRDT
ncbi:MAG: hypothetical protein ACR2PQ_01340, partial [Myxococcota bacterium]